MVANPSAVTQSHSSILVEWDVTSGDLVNQTKGTADRNGTSSHTIPFGFTSTSGNLLVVVVAGSVTNAAAGWIEVAVTGNSELSVFRKTSAGESSIDVTHNASDYPVRWVAMELSLASWLNATTNTGAATDPPVLSGLTSTNKWFFASVSRTAPGTTGTVSRVWTDPANELDDTVVLGDGSTDGIWFSIAYDADTAATSITPAGVTTAASPPFTGVANYETVTFAIAVTDETGYRVERSPNGSTSWTDISGNLPVNTDSYLDTGLASETQYFYRIIAFNAEGDSEPSDVVSAITSGVVPTGRRCCSRTRRCCRRVSA